MSSRGLGFFLRFGKILAWDFWEFWELKGSRKKWICGIQKAKKLDFWDGMNGISVIPEYLRGSCDLMEFLGFQSLKKNRISGMGFLGFQKAKKLDLWDFWSGMEFPGMNGVSENLWNFWGYKGWGKKKGFMEFNRNDCDFWDFRGEKNGNSGNGCLGFLAGFWDGSFLEVYSHFFPPSLPNFLPFLLQSGFFPPGIPSQPLEILELQELRSGRGDAPETEPGSRQVRGNIPKNPQNLGIRAGRDFPSHP